MPTRAPPPLTFGYPDNGILAKVGGEYVARASKTLPDAETAPADEMSAEIDADWVGRVCITYRRQHYRHGKSSHWAWCAVRADAIEPQLD